VEGKPLDDITLLENVNGVMKSGEWLIEPEPAIS
jgi:hypothetical protein